jgi:hypothetical protein
MSDLLKIIIWEGPYMARYEWYDQNHNYFITFDQQTNYPPGSYPRCLNDFIEEHVNVEPFAVKRNNDFYGKPAKHAKTIENLLERARRVKEREDKRAIAKQEAKKEKERIERDSLCDRQRVSRFGIHRKFDERRL